MVDHGRLNSQIDSFAQQQLVVGGAVLARIEHFFVVESLYDFGQAPVHGLCAGHANGVKSFQYPEIIHSGRCCKINRIRLSYRDDVSVEICRGFGIFRNEKIAVCAADGNECKVIIIVDRKLGCIVKRHVACRLHSCPGRSMGISYCRIVRCTTSDNPHTEQKSRNYE